MPATSRVPWLPLSLAIGAIAMGGCGDRSLDDDEARDPDPPELSVLSPDRGLVQSNGTVRVTGRVRDDQSGLEAVQVNGVAAQINGDGSFEAEITVPAGLTLIQTTASDVAGNETRDTRSVLSGELADHDEPVREAMAAHLSSETFDMMAGITSTFINNTDLGQLAQAANPIYENGGCLGAEVDVETITKSDTEIALTPVGGGLQISFALTDLDIDMDADYEVACIGGSAGLYLNADRFTLSGMLEVDIVDGQIDISLVDTQASFEGFELDVGIIPSSVVNLFVSDLDEKVANMIRNQVDQMVPSMMAAFLGDLTSSAFEFQVFERTLAVSIAPTVADFNTNGGTIAMDSNILIKDAFGPGYVYTPTSMPSATDLRSAGQAFRVALADDAVNQVLASMHASGMLDVQFELEGEGDGSLLGDVADRVDLHLLQPPVLRADVMGDSVEIVVGDLLIDVINVKDGNDLVVTRAAISGRLQLKANVENGAVKLTTMTPDLWVDLVADGVSGPNLLAYDEVEALATVGVARVANVIDEMLSGFPIPAFAGTTVGSTTFEPQAGYVIVGGALTQE